MSSSLVVSPRVVQDICAALAKLLAIIWSRAIVTVTYVTSGRWDYITLFQTFASLARG